MGAHVAEKLLWVDLETSGSDERIDRILEVGAIVTDGQFTVLEQDNWLIGQGGVDWRSTMVPIVREMHTDNGLLEALDAHRNTVPIEQAAEELLGMARRHERRTRTMQLAGSGVSHFDMRFLRRDMPELVEFLHHAPMDVGQFRRWLIKSGWEIPDDEPGKAHRALADIVDHLAEARHLTTMVGARRPTV